MLTINGLTVRLGGRTILDRASAAVPPGAHVGLIGRNGAGKSTLMKSVIGQIDPDEGSIDMPRRTRLGYIAQEAPSGTATPFDTVLAADVERARLMDEAEHCSDPHRLGDIHDRLLAIDAYAAPARASRILLGLGFDEAMQGQPLDAFSGGWKMRVALAALLFSEPDLLLLDEPTNHLDVDSREALVQALNGYEGAVIIVSHDRHMIELTADRLVLVENGSATEYAGSVDDYIDLVLGRGASAPEKPKQQRHDRKAAARAREDARALKKAAAEAEAASARLAAQCSALDRAMFDPANAPTEFANLPMSELSKRRARVAAELEAAEARWLDVNEQLERLAA